MPRLAPLAVLLTLLASAAQAAPIEFPADVAEDWTVVPLADGGALLLGRDGGWTASVYSDDLVMQRSAPLAIPHDRQLVRTRQFADYALLTFDRNELLVLRLSDGSSRPAPATRLLAFASALLPAPAASVVGGYRDRDGTAVFRMDLR